MARTLGGQERPRVRRRVDQYRPNRNKVTQLFFSGLAATVAMVAFTYLVSLLDVPVVNYAGMYGAVLNVREYPATFTGVWWLGLFWHILNGALIFPLFFDFLADRRMITSQRWLKGLAFGGILWLLTEAVVKPLSGDGFFSNQMPAPVLGMWLNLAAWLVYGFVLERMTRVRIVHQIAVSEREAA